MKIEIEIQGNSATVKCGKYEEKMKRVWLMKQFKLNDLYHYLKDRNVQKTSTDKTKPKI